jgi:hypothetical protein
MPIKKRQISSDEKEKLACAQCFLCWYIHQYGEVCSLLETEEVFPELNGNMRWDFVVTPKNGSEDHKLAIEVKRIIRGNVRGQRSLRWSPKFGQVAKRVFCS